MAQYTKPRPPAAHSEAGSEADEQITAKPLITEATDPLAPVARRSRLREPRPETVSMGPLEKAYLFWIVGASCDGCTIAISGATHPPVESLLNGTIPDPRRGVMSLVEIRSFSTYRVPV